VLAVEVGFVELFLGVVVVEAYCCGALVFEGYEEFSGGFAVNLT
jgi:hypothetical protein